MTEQVKSVPKTDSEASSDDEEDIQEESQTKCWYEMEGLTEEEADALLNEVLNDAEQDIDYLANSDQEIEIPSLDSETEGSIVVPPRMSRAEFKKIRDSLAEFFKKRIKENKWNLYGPMPQRGVDKEFDIFLTEIKLGNNRTYAAGQWRTYRYNNGIYPPPSFQSNKDVLKKDFEQRVRNKLPSILEKITKYIEECEYKNHVIKESELLNFKQLAGGSLVQDIIKECINEMTTLLVEALAGCTSRALDKRILNMEFAIHSTNRNDFVDDVRKLFDLPKVSSNKIFFNDLYMYVYKEWGEAITSGGSSDFIDNLDNDVVEHILGESVETVYYVAGYLLFLICRVQKSEISQQVARTFASANTFKSLQNAKRAKLPTEKMEWKDKGQSALQYSKDKWFHFVSLLEALFIVNMTPAQAMCRRARLFEDIRKSMIQNKAVRDKFEACLPDGMTNNDKTIMWKIFEGVVLPSHSRLKSRDIIRNLQHRKKKSGENCLALRKQLVAQSIKNN